MVCAGKGFLRFGRNEKIKNMKTSIIIVAAGRGKRFGQNKWQVKLGNKSLLEWNLDTVSGLNQEKEIIIVAPENDLEKVQAVADKHDFSEIKVIAGGRERFDSVKKGLEHCTGEIVIIHNVANPLAKAEDYLKLIEILEKESFDYAQESDAAIFVGQKAVDTLRRIKEGASETIDRKDVWRVQTPQGFRKDSLSKTIKETELNNPSDEIRLFEGLEIPIRAIETSAINQKITYPEDLELMEKYLRSEVLVGIGEDSHYFDDSGTMVLAGVRIDDLPKLHGNSDGDLILHALCNAISSALGEGSIGPVADPMAEQGILDSTKYLEVILNVVKERGYSLGNVSISLECARPKIEPISGQLKESLSALLNLDPQKIGITVTSGEGLTSFGRGEGVRCICVVSLLR